MVNLDKLYTFKIKRVSSFNKNNIAFWHSELKCGQCCHLALLIYLTICSFLTCLTMSNFGVQCSLNQSWNANKISANAMTYLYACAHLYHVYIWLHVTIFYSELKFSYVYRWLMASVWPAIFCTWRPCRTVVPNRGAAAPLKCQGCRQILN